MNLRDRVKQTATATSDTAYVFTGGEAPAGYRTFVQAFLTSTLSVGGDYPFYNVPLLVESGAQWQIVVGQLNIDNDNTAVFSNGVVMASSTGAALGLSAAVVVVTLVSTVETLALLGLAPPDAITDADVGVSGTNSLRPTVYPGGLMAIGAAALCGWIGTPANGVNSVAIGRKCQASFAHAHTRGAGFTAKKAAADHFGLGKVDHTAAWQQVGVAHGVANAKTTNTTLTVLGVFDEAGNTIANGEKMYCDAGLHRVRGVVTAVDPATGDMALWDVSFTVQTTMDYATTNVFGSATITAHGSNAAGLSALTVAVNADDATNSVWIEVTGKAATTLIWGYTYESHHHNVDTP